MKEYAILDDTLLLQLISQGDSMAFTEIYNRHKDKLYGFSLQLSGSHEKAADLVHDVFFKIWDQRESLAGKEVFAGYLYTMLRNFCLDHFRNFVRETRIKNEISLEISDNGLTTDLDLDYKELKTKVALAINHLPPRQKEIYILHREECLKYNEIAQRLNLSVSTVENHFSRALTSIRMFLNREYMSTLLYFFLILLN